MALQVWLPLTQDFRNQGLCNIGTPTLQNQTMAISGGKLGTKYLTQASGQALIFHTNANITDNHWTIACWVKPLTINNSGNTIIAQLNSSTSSDNTFYQSIISSATNFNTWNIGINGTLYDCAKVENISANVWYHYAATYDGATLRLYVNGVLKNSTSISKTFVAGTNLTLCGRSNNAAGTSMTSNGTCAIQDFRLYNHTCSQDDIRHLAQALILWYPMNQPERSKNMMKSGVVISDISGKSTLTKTQYSWTAAYKSGGSPTVRIQSLGFNGMTSQTVSFDQYVNTGTLAVSIDICDLGGKSIAVTTKKKRYFNQVSGINQYNTASTPYNGFVDCSFTLASGQTLYVENIKVEPGLNLNWSPAPEDSLNWGTKELDCSGFGNNADFNTAAIDFVKQNHNSSKYRNGYLIESSCPKWMEAFKSGNKLTFLQDQQFTVSFWQYSSDWTNSDSTVTSYIISAYSGTNGGFRIYSSAGADRYRFYWLDNATTPTGQSLFFHSTTKLSSGWHFFTATFDGDTVKTYMDGQVYQQKSSTSVKFTDSMPTLGFGHSQANTFPCTLQDFRLYAAQLSADDIQELYHSAVVTDHTGHTSAYEYFQQ